MAVKCDLDNQAHEEYLELFALETSVVHLKRFDM